MPGVWQPVFASESLPATFAFREPIRADHDEEDEDQQMDADDEDVGSDAEFRPSPSPTDRPRIKRAPSAEPQLKLHPHTPIVNFNQDGTDVKPRIGQGGQAVVRKPVKVDMDSDDEIIWTMKNEGYKDEPVRDRLIAEGRTTYDYKTIATRYSRMRRIMAGHEEQCLDEDFSDFHEDEDDLLTSCYTKADVAHQARLEEAEIAHWKDIADLMETHMKRKKYTKNSARARYTSLQNGTAILPIEQDPNAAERSAQRLHLKLKRDAYKEAKRMKAQKDKREARERAEREEREAITEKVRKEEERRKKRLAREAASARAKINREARAKVKKEEEESKAEKAAQTVFEREEKKRQAEEERAQKAWEKEVAKVKRREDLENEKLRRIQEEADRKMNAIIGGREDQQRRDLIRRHFRGQCGYKGLAAGVESLEVKKARWNVKDERD